MPTHFGPSLGPRQGPDARTYGCTNTPAQLVLDATYRVDGAQLADLLPPGFSLTDSPSLSASFAYITEIGWLAGRGYNTFGISVPAIYQGGSGRVRGDLLLVLWENMADPIITGREELGFSKVYCELPEPLHLDDRVIGRASWDGFEFASLELGGLGADAPAAALREDSEPSQGTLHYKYMPRTGATGEADAAYTVLTPAEAPNLKVLSEKHATTASLRFNTASWEQLPTLVNIVNRLAEIELGELVGATVRETRGFKDLSDQRRLD